MAVKRPRFSEVFNYTEVYFGLVLVKSRAKTMNQRYFNRFPWQRRMPAQSSPGFSWGNVTIMECTSSKVASRADAPSTIPTAGGMKYKVLIMAKVHKSIREALRTMLLKAPNRASQSWSWRRRTIWLYSWGEMKAWISVPITVRQPAN